MATGSCVFCAYLGTECTGTCIFSELFPSGTDNPDYQLLVSVVPQQELEEMLESAKSIGGLIKRETYPLEWVKFQCATLRHHQSKTDTDIMESKELSLGCNQIPNSASNMQSGSVHSTGCIQHVRNISQNLAYLVDQVTTLSQTSNTFFRTQMENNISTSQTLAQLKGRISNSLLELASDNPYKLAFYCNQMCKNTELSQSISDLNRRLSLLEYAGDDPGVVAFIRYQISKNLDTSVSISDVERRLLAMESSISAGRDGCSSAGGGGRV